MRVIAKPSTNPLYKTELQRIRAESRLSESDLARQAGVSKGTVNMAERGLRGVYIRSAVAIAGALERPVEDLFAPAPDPERG